jgi:hypothetical protein
MLKFAEFDIKTGQAITNYDPETGGQTQGYKESPISYLEHWLKDRGLQDAPLYAAQFYDGVTPEDNERLLAQDKHIIFTGGTSGKHVYAYFTDTVTAKEILEGSLFDSPIYDYGDKTAHYSLAYGSLPISDCYEEVVVKGGNGAKILIIDDEKQSAGQAPILDKAGNPVEDLDDLMSKMGDGTILIPTASMRELLLEKEVQTIIRRAITATDRSLTKELGVMGQWLDEVTGDEIENELVALVAAEYRDTGKVGTFHVSADISRNIGKMLDKAADEGIIQFRAAITDTPGMIKGTAKTSKWAERLGVAAIVSLNDIKGAGGQLSEAGIFELNQGSTFWAGRKEVATWGRQSVGMQVKITIPTATEKELNPIALAKAQELAEIAPDPYLLGQKYLEKANRKNSNPVITIDDSGEVTGQVSRIDSIAQILAQDTYGELAQMPAIQRRLVEALRSDWLDAAVSGVEVPSAIAQHHGELDVWEISNRDLPNGAIVSFYRSPLPNVSAVALGVNNLNKLQSTDPESFNKLGAVYINPWTAKDIAITDFDGDRLGQFVGYLAKDPEKFIAQMQKAVNGLDAPAERYDAAHLAIEKFIAQGTELAPADFPITVQELASATAVENRPQQIKKAPKVPHPWLKEEGQAVSHAIFKGWTRVADNPIGKVANLGMNMQILAQNAANTPDQQKPDLLAKVYKKFAKLEDIPDNDYLVSAGLPALDLNKRIGNIKSLYQGMSDLKGTGAKEQRIEMATQGLAEVSSLLKNYAEYPVASLLQTSVDYLKSSNGIDERLFNFGQNLAYQQNSVRSQMKSDWVYSSGSPPAGVETTALSANTIEPIGNHVNAVSAIFKSVLTAQKDIRLGREDPNSSIRPIVPLTHSQQDSKSVDKWVGKYVKATSQLKVAANRQQEERAEDLQPTLSITSANNGRKLQVQKLIRAQKELDPQNINAIWDLSDGQPRDFVIKFTDPSIANKNEKLDPYMVYVVDPAGENSVVGFATPEMIEASGIKGLDQELREKGGKIFNGGLPELTPPRSMVNDIDRHKSVMNKVLSDFQAAIPVGREERALSALWHGNQTTDRRERNSSVGMSIATKIAANQLVQYVGVERSMDLGTVTDFGNEVASKGIILDVRIDNVIKKEGKGAVPMVSAILLDGSTKEIGGMLRNSIPLAPGTVVSALATKKLNPQIDIKIGEEKYRVKPSLDQSEQTIISTKALIGFNVSEAGISITATTIPKKKTEVPITTDLGTLYPKDRAEFLKSGVQSAEGIYSRTLHPNQIELHVQDLVAHQPVSKILANTLLPLPDREINPDLTAILEKPQLTLVPEIEAVVNPSPQDNLPAVELEVNLRIVPDIPQTYSPSRIELVDWYKASLKVAEPATAQYLVELGTQLKSVYTSEALSQGNPPVDRLPDAYQSSEVSITIDEKDKFDGILAAAQQQELQTSKQVSRGSR